MTGLFDREPVAVAPGAVHLPGWLDGERQRELAGWCRRWSESAGGFRSPRMPSGGTMSALESPMPAGSAFTAAIACSYFCESAATPFKVSAPSLRLTEPVENRPS